MHPQVLFINSRLDANENPGGDCVQLTETKAALERLGLTVHLRNPLELEKPPPFDIAHVFNLQMPDAAALAFEALRKTGKPIVLSSIYWDLWEYWFEAAAVDRPRWRWLAQLDKERARALYVDWQRRKAPWNAQWKLQRMLLQQADRVLPNSEDEGKLLIERFSPGEGFAKKIDAIPNGIDRSRYERRPAPSRSFLDKYGIRDFVLQVGTISPVKNQLGLIEALFDEPVPLVFVGHTPEEMQDYARRCRARAEQRGDVVFIDHLPASELPGIYAAAAVHALPSWRETPGLVSLEAACCGCRIVTTSVGSTQEYFGDQAWYCHPANVQSIRDAVRAALAAPRSEALRERVLRELTWDRAAEATLASYERTLGFRKGYLRASSVAAASHTTPLMVLSL